MPLEYPVFSNLDHASGRDPKWDLAWRAGYARCSQWMSTTPPISGVVPERPKNPYLDPFNGQLADAWEDGWSSSLTAMSKGRGF